MTAEYESNTYAIEGNETINYLFHCYMNSPFVTTTWHIFSFRIHNFVSTQRKIIVNNNSQWPDNGGLGGWALGGLRLNFLTVRKGNWRTGTATKLSKYY